MHPNAGRKHTAEHIAKRVAAVAAARAARTPERCAQIAENMRLAQLGRSAESKDEAAQRFAVSNARVSDRPTIIYALRREVDSPIRYVGKTGRSAHERLRRHLVAARRGDAPRVSNWIRSLLAKGETPIMEVIETVPPGEDWVAREQHHIDAARREFPDLLNHCDGGQGTPGIIFTDQHRDRIRRAHIGRKIPAEVVALRSEGLRQAWARNPASRWKPETLAKMLATKSERRARGEYKKRRPATEETKAKIRATKAANRAA